MLQRRKRGEKGGERKKERIKWKILLLTLLWFKLNNWDKGSVVVLVFDNKGDIFFYLRFKVVQRDVSGHWKEK